MVVLAVVGVVFVVGVAMVYSGSGGCGGNIGGGCGGGNMVRFFGVGTLA